MTRRIPFPCLETEIQARMEPVERKRDRWFWLRVAGYAAASGPAGLGVFLAVVFILPVAAVFRRGKR